MGLGPTNFSSLFLLIIIIIIHSSSLWCAVGTRIITVNSVNWIGSDLRTLSERYVTGEIWFRRVVEGLFGGVRGGFRLGSVWPRALLAIQERHLSPQFPQQILLPSLPLQLPSPSFSLPTRSWFVPFLFLQIMQIKNVSLINGWMEKDAHQLFADLFLLGVHRVGQSLRFRLEFFLYFCAFPFSIWLLFFSIFTLSFMIRSVRVILLNQSPKSSVLAKICFHCRIACSALRVGFWNHGLSWRSYIVEGYGIFEEIYPLRLLDEKNKKIELIFLFVKTSLCIC